MGSGTGVLTIYYLVCFIRGISTGVASTSSLLLAKRLGITQHLLVASRGVGLTLGPAVLGRGIGRMVWAGEAQTGFAAVLAVKLVFELVVSRTSASSALYVCYFVVGLTTAVLDTSGYLLVGRVYGKQCNRPYMMYCAAYGFGSMVSPWLVVLLRERAWDVLALSEFLLVVFLARKRLFHGKPRNWKLAVRGLAAPKSVASEDVEHAAASPADTPGNGTHLAAGPGNHPNPVPRRVLATAMAFIFIMQAAETSVSCWSFTYGAEELGLSETSAAILPSAFYCAFTVMRAAVIPLTSRLLPSTIAHASAAMALFFAFAFYHCATTFRALVLAGTLPDEMVGRFQALVVCLAGMGASTCPLFATMLAAVRQHGEMTAPEHGCYDTCNNLGMTTGMWLPGFVALPKVELLGSLGMFLILNSSVRDFPWRKRQVQAIAAT